MSKKQLGADQPAWGHARGTSAPPICKSHEKAHSRNTLDPASGTGKMGKSIAQSGKKGSNSPKE